MTQSSQGKQHWKRSHHLCRHSAVECRQRWCGCYVLLHERWRWEKLCRWWLTGAYEFITLSVNVTFQPISGRLSIRLLWLKSPPSLQGSTAPSVGTTVFRGKFCQIPRRHLPNSAAHRGKFLEFRGSPRPPTLELLCRLWPSYKFIIINSSTARIYWCKICNKIWINFSLFFMKTLILMTQDDWVITDDWWVISDWWLMT